MSAAPPGLDNEWQLATQMASVPQSGLRHIEVQDTSGAMHPLHLCRVGEEVVAFEGPCPLCGESLTDNAVLVEGSLSCACGKLSIDIQAQLDVATDPHPNWRPVMLVDEDIYVWMDSAPTVE